MSDDDNEYEMASTKARPKRKRPLGGSKVSEESMDESLAKELRLMREYLDKPEEKTPKRKKAPVEEEYEEVDITTKTKPKTKPKAKPRAKKPTKNSKSNDKVDVVIEKKLDEKDSTIPLRSLVRF